MFPFLTKIKPGFNFGKIAGSSISPNPRVKMRPSET